MKTIQITVRNVDPLLKRRFDKLARLKDVSINDLALEAFQDKVGGAATSQNAISWRQYSGTLPGDGINQSVLDDFEKIDQTMWSDTGNDSR